MNDLNNIRLNSDENIAFRFFKIYKDSLLLKKTLVHHIYEDQQGLLWLSSYTDGVFVIDPGTKKCQAHYYHDLKDPNSIGNDVMYAITQDWNGSYWMSTLKGLYHFDPQSKVFTLYENEKVNEQLN